MGVLANAAPGSQSGLAVEAAPYWPWWQRTLFRFVCVYLGLYCLASSAGINLSSVPFGDLVRQGLSWPVSRLALWAGTHIVHLSGVAATRHPTGSGDTALDWVECCVLLALATLGTSLWSVWGRRRTAHPVLAVWLFLVVRYTLALALISYGLIKIAPVQFGTLTYRQLAEPIGSASPMGLLWTFMAASPLTRPSAARWSSPPACCCSSSGRGCRARCSRWPRWPMCSYSISATTWM